MILTHLISHIVVLFLTLSSTMRSYSCKGTSFLLASLLLCVEFSLKLNRAMIFLTSCLCRNSVMAMKVSKGKMTNIKAEVITDGESKSSKRDSAAAKMINCKIMPSSIFRISVIWLYCDMN